MNYSGTYRDYDNVSVSNSVKHFFKVQFSLKINFRVIFFLPSGMINSNHVSTIHTNKSIHKEMHRDKCLSIDE